MEEMDLEESGYINNIKLLQQNIIGFRQWASKGMGNRMDIYFDPKIRPQMEDIIHYLRVDNKRLSHTLRVDVNSERSDMTYILNIIGLNDNAFVTSITSSINKKANITITPIKEGK